jgi:predicted ribosomally synthesized peptide with SipW-like signal peptide
MKSVFLSVVVVCALAIAGIGGTFATWSDSETSMDNYIETGSVDLLVNGFDDQPWGAGVPAKVEIDCMIPCKVYGPYIIDLWNASQDCMPASEAYIHIKNADCSNAEPKPGSGYPDPTTGDMKPEPELVAEHGGKVNCTEVEGVGILGDGCTMKSHVRMWITDDPTLVPDPDIPYPDPRFIVDAKILPLICHEIYLFDLDACTPDQIYLYFHLQQPSEEEFGKNYIPNYGEPGYDEMEWLKFNDWPSWGLMKDRIDFDIEFDLWLVDP